MASEGVKSTNQLSALNRVFHVERCVSEFKPSVYDIQIKRLNGFYRIYCYGHNITLNTRTVTCPNGVFELPFTQHFVLNGHENKVSKRVNVMIDPYELQINREIAQRLKLKTMIIKGIDTSMLDKSVSMMNGMLRTVGLNVTIDNAELTDFIPSFGWIGEVMSMIWAYAKYLLIVFLVIIVLLLFTLLSPVLQIIALIARLSISWFRREPMRAHRRSDLRDHYV